MILTKHNGQLVRVTPIDQLNFDNFRPIGSLYFQFPGKADPNTLFPDSTWTNISSSYAGDFMRTLGSGSAGTSMPDACFSNTSCINCYYQADQADNSRFNMSASGTITMNGHTHIFYTGAIQSGDYNKTIVAYPYECRVDVYSHNSNGRNNGLYYTYSSICTWSGWVVPTMDSYQTYSVTTVMQVTNTDPETRPYNYTIRVWQRTA